MNKTIDAMIELQSVDSKIMELNEVKGDLPQRVESVQERLDSLKSEQSELRNSLQEMEKEHRQKVADLEDQNVRLNKYKEQVFLVTSTKEHEAITNETDQVKSEISDLEIGIIELDDSMQSLNESLSSMEETINETSSSLNSNKKMLDEALVQTGDELSSLESSRESLLTNVENRYMHEYDKLKTAHGVGMVSVSRGSCGNCFSSLPPQFLVEVRSRETLHTCTGCGVFLFWEEEQSKEL